MFSRRLFSVFATVLAAGSLAVLPGCNWLQGSGSDVQLSPFLSNLSISPSSVLCDEKFSVSFSYEDPQGDIAKATVTFQFSGDTTVREETPAWPDANKRSSSGTVKFEGFTLACDSSKVGLWSIKVQVEDERKHTSNILSGGITLR